MTSYNNYQIEEKKNEKSNNIFKRPAKSKKKDDKGDGFWENFEYYITYYRDNPHRFCIEYFGMYLHWWQQFVLWVMWHTGNTIFLASRGSGKSYLTMVYCIARACLYPGTIIRVAAANKRQASLLLAKVKEIQRNCPLVEREIADISIGKDEAKITFHGGSEVATVVASDNARGERCNVLIIDERVIVDKEIIDKVFIPFLTATRQPPYLKYPQYSHLKEEETNHFIQLSSIGTKTDSLYAEFEQYLGFIKQGNPDYSAFSLPYQFALDSGVISRKTIEKMVRESTTSIEAFKQEMEVIPTGSNESSMFNFETLNRCRKIHIPLIPITDDEYIQNGGNITKYPYYQKKEVDELRLISMDLALMGGRKNDASVFTVFRLTKDGNQYIKEIAYIETMNGINIEPQVLRFKQLFYDLECDFAALDCGGIGQAFYDLCTKKTEDLLRNKKYDAWKTRNPNPALEDRIVDENAEPLLFTIKVSGSGAALTHASIISRARLNFEKRKINLLLNEEDIIEELNTRYKFNVLKSSQNQQDNETATRLIMPFIQTTKLIEEAIYTQVIQLKSGGVEMDEKNGRKDRLMSMLYGLHFIDLLEQDLFKKEKKFNVKDYYKSGSSNNTSSGVVNPFSNNLNKLRGFGIRR